MLKRSMFISALICFSLSLSAQTKPRISILGDSYSTFENYIPQGNETWYFQKLDTARTDVHDVRQTWWWQLIKNNGFLLEKNDSYSGATISYTGYNDEDYSPRSFITRLPRLGSPDILLIFGCTNDSWAGVKTGDYCYENFTRGDLYFYRPALAKLLDEALCRYPNVKIYFIINSGLREEIVESTETICNRYGVKYIKLKDIDKHWGHPTIKGMKEISDQIWDVLKKDL